MCIGEGKGEEGRKIPWPGCKGLLHRRAGKKLSVKRVNIEAWKGTRTVSFYTHNKERARLWNATCFETSSGGVSSITRKSSVDFSSTPQAKNPHLFVFNIFFRNIVSKLYFTPTVERTFSITSHGQLRGRASMREDPLATRVPDMHRIASQRSGLPQDCSWIFRKRPGEGGTVGFHTERVSKYRRDADRFRDDEGERERRWTMPSVFNDLRIWKG